MSRSREGKKVALNAIRIREPIGGLLKGYVLRRNEVVPHPLFQVALVALLYLAGCADQGIPLSVQGRSLSAHLRLKQKQVALFG